jgi:hypothetical protein
MKTILFVLGSLIFAPQLRAAECPNFSGHYRDLKFPSYTLSIQQTDCSRLILKYEYNGSAQETYTVLTNGTPVEIDRSYEGFEINSTSLYEYPLRKLEDGSFERIPGGGGATWTLDPSGTLEIQSVYNPGGGAHANVSRSAWERIDETN